MSLIVRLLAIAVLFGTLVLLIGPATTMETTRPGVDKAAHFIAFGLVLWALGVLFRRPSRLVLAIVAATLGSFTEIVQAMVGRDAEVLDFVADALGVLTALLVWSLWRCLRPRKAADPVKEAAPR